MLPQTEPEEREEINVDEVFGLNTCVALDVLSVPVKIPVFAPVSVRPTNSLSPGVGYDVVTQTV